MKKYFLLALLVWMSTDAYAQNTFEKVIDTLGFSGSNCVKQTFDGGYIIAGYRYTPSTQQDASILKLDSLGNIEWIKIYGAGGSDEGIEITQMPDSGYLFYGCYDCGAASKSWLIRLNQNGDSLWSNVIYLNAQKTTPQAMDYSLIYYTPLTGYCEFSTIPMKIYLITVNTNGDTIFSRMYGSGNHYAGFDVKQTNDLGYIICGSRYSPSSAFDIYFIKTDLFGDTIWTKTYSSTGFGYDHAFSVEQTSDSGFIATGIFANSTTMSNDFYLLRMNSNGDTLWFKVLSNGIEAVGYSIEETKDKGFIAVGAIGDTNGTNYNFYLLRTNSIGDTLWTKEFGGSGNEVAHSVMQTKDEGFIITGESNGNSNGQNGYFVVKTDSLGNVFNQTGLPQINNPFSLIVYPNPCNGLCYYELISPPQKNYSIEITDAFGNLKYSCHIKQSNNSIKKGNVDLTKEAAGLYFVLLRDHNNLIMKKLIIQK